MAIAWRTRLQTLPFSTKEKGAIIHKFRVAAKWGEESIQEHFDKTVECGGEELLISALQEMLLFGGDATQQKRIQIFVPRAEGEDVVLVARWFSLTETDFVAMILTKGYIVPFKGGVVKKVENACRFQDLIEGESYLLEDFSGFTVRVKALENFNMTEMHACEEELAAAMAMELKAHGIAKNPIIRNDLRVHCRGTATEQEFDAVLLDGEHQAFIGSAKHVACGTAEIEDMLRKVKILADRARDGDRYPSYVPFQGRSLGCCMRIDSIQEDRKEAVKHMCFRKGIGLFQQSGAALAMQRIPCIGAQSLEPGFINMVVRGLRRLAR